MDLRPERDLQIEEADPSIIVIRYQRTAQNPGGNVIQLKCPPEECLIRAREIMAEAAPHIQLPLPEVYKGLRGGNRESALREEWRTIFTFYVQNCHFQVTQTPAQEFATGNENATFGRQNSPLLSLSQSLASPMEMVSSRSLASNSQVDSTAPQELTVASSALLTSHNRAALIEPSTLCVDFSANAGSLLFLKRFRIRGSKSRARSSRPYLEINKQHNGFTIIGQGLAKHDQTGNIFQCTVQLIR